MKRLKYYTWYNKTSDALGGMAKPETAVFNIILSFIKNDMECFMSLNNFKECIGCSKPTVIKALSLLEDMGYIEKSFSNYSVPNNYTIRAEAIENITGGRGYKYYSWAADNLNGMCTVEMAIFSIIYSYHQDHKKCRMSQTYLSEQINCTRKTVNRGVNKLRDMGVIDAPYNYKEVLEYKINTKLIETWQSRFDYEHSE